MTVFAEYEQAMICLESPNDYDSRDVERAEQFVQLFNRFKADYWRKLYEANNIINDRMEAAEGAQRRQTDDYRIGVHAGEFRGYKYARIVFLQSLCGEDARGNGAFTDFCNEQRAIDYNRSLEEKSIAL